MSAGGKSSASRLRTSGGLRKYDLVPVDVAKRDNTRQGRGVGLECVQKASRTSLRAGRQ
jgi:hypothetical protein